MRKKAIDWVLTGFSLAGIISTIPVMAVQLRINKTKNVGKSGGSGAETQQCAALYRTVDWER